jgi:hypothetical protein
LLKPCPLLYGNYTTVVSSGQNWEFCQNEELDIELHEIDSQLTLTIGPRLVFPDLQSKRIASKLGKNCVVTTSNDLKANSLQQVVTEICGKKTEYMKTHSFQLIGDVLNYKFLDQGKTQICDFKFMKTEKASK